MKLKPYMLVAVQHGKPYAPGSYHTIGEVMSFPLPGGTVMVRRVPGHPGTLEEVSVARLSAPTRKHRFVRYAKVSGHGQFPVDMLRYDAAVPVNFTVQDTDRGPKAVVDPAFGHGDDLIIATVSETAHGHDFTDARWQSFLWRVERMGAPERIEAVS